MGALGLFLCAISTQIVQSAAQGTPATPAQQPLPATIEFNRDIRPILSDKCFQCHGPGTQMATLRFDQEEGAKRALKDGRFAIVPGDPAHSQMIGRITATNPAVRMPRSQNGAAAGEPLSERQVALLTRWIEQGATWQKHWSFIPPKRPDVPKDVNDSNWVRNPIDAFVLQRLEREGLKPSPEADRTTLLRRVSFDLTGLPPTPAELDAFLADRSANAYETVVDRLLRSPQYGERMQASVPELTDLSKEPEHTYELYGQDSRRPGTYAANCLMARRLAERGVRFIQVYHRAWDHHSGLPRAIRATCQQVDQPSAGLVQDLKERGLLDDTLVIWAGEFGRTVYSQGKLTADDYGRDHHPRAFTIWMAGGGVKPGISLGETDDYGYNITADPVHVHDLNATVLRCLGIDHTRLTYKYSGRNFRLTDTGGRVFQKALAFDAKSLA